MTRWLLLFACACSTPAKKQAPPAPPADDEGSAVAWQRAHPGSGAGPAPFSIDWDKARAFTEKARTTPRGELPCDYRITALPQKGHECLKGGPGRLVLAAKAKDKRAIDDERTEVRIDLGAELAVDESWVAAVLDDSGRPISAWTRPDEVRRWDATITFALRTTRIDRDTARIAVMKEPPP